MEDWEDMGVRISTQLGHLPGTYQALVGDHRHTRGWEEPPAARQDVVGSEGEGEVEAGQEWYP